MACQGDDATADGTSGSTKLRIPTFSQPEVISVSLAGLRRSTSSSLLRQDRLSLSPFTLLQHTLIHLYPAWTSTERKAPRTASLELCSHITNIHRFSPRHCIGIPLRPLTPFLNANAFSRQRLNGTVGSMLYLIAISFPNFRPKQTFDSLIMVILRLTSILPLWTQQSHSVMRECNSSQNLHSSEPVAVSRIALWRHNLLKSARTGLEGGGGGRAGRRQKQHVLPNLNPKRGSFGSSISTEGIDGACANYITKFGTSHPPTEPIPATHVADKR
jgi:hypothetical protein